MAHSSPRPPHRSRLRSCASAFAEAGHSLVPVPVVALAVAAAKQAAWVTDD